MHVILGDVRQVVVDDVRQRFDIEPARRDVGGDEHADLSLLEFGKRALALILTLVAMDRVGVDAVARELLREAVGAVLGAAEHQHLFPVIGFHQVREQFAFAGAIDRMRDLRDELGRRIAPRDLDGHRLMHERRRELADFLREGRREQQVLPLRRQ